jgi:hypothetical protein
MRRGVLRVELRDALEHQREQLRLVLATLDHSSLPP